MLHPTFVTRFFLATAVLSLVGCLGVSTTSSMASTTSPSGAMISVVSDSGIVSLTENDAKESVIKCGSRNFVVAADRVNFSGNIFCPLPEGVKTIDIQLKGDSLTIVADGKTIWEE